ncbi:NADH oxidase [Thermoanaerobacter brockii] [Rhizoctonia solani]|uniref:NADH oxidase [Thermoanaerobacter brockii] n=1 Tax=Rhizoctonia solani TaxID=456999 RepID=A0A0K6G0F4_9AGAM|nr:NADH oxidase [Thermoanaerobacter brockii] [Rhizoctonia solani]
MGERMYSWDQRDPTARGTPSDRLIRLYETWGRGGYGIITTGHIVVDTSYLATPGNGAITQSNSTPTHIDQFRRMASAGKAHGSLVVMQLSHAGRKAPGYINSHPVSAGDVRLDEQATQPTPLTKEGIDKVVNQFAYAAAIAHQAGFDGIQLDASNGFLLSQFLSTQTNNRSDNYGGDIENRARIIRDLVELVRKEVKDPAFVIGIKIRRDDFQDKINDAKHLCQMLEGLRFDFIELSASGGAYGSSKSQDQSASPLKEFAEQISPLLSKTLVFVCGGFHSSQDMASAIRDGHCACVGLGRTSGSDPLLPSLIIGGHIGGATKPDPDNIDPAVLPWASLTQMQAIAQGKDPIDLSDAEVLRDFNRRAKKFEEQQREGLKQGHVKVGYVGWDEAT